MAIRRIYKSLFSKPNSRHGRMFQEVIQRKHEGDFRRVKRMQGKGVPGKIILSPSMSANLLFGVAHLHKIAGKPEPDILRARILNLGSGYGLFEKVSGDLGFTNVVGIEKSKKAVEASNTLLEGNMHATQVLHGDYAKGSTFSDRDKSEFDYVVSNSSVPAKRFPAVAGVIAPRIRKDGGIAIRFLSATLEPKDPKFAAKLKKLGLEKVEHPELSGHNIFIYQKTRDN